MGMSEICGHSSEEDSWKTRCCIAKWNHLLDSVSEDPQCGEWSAVFVNIPLTNEQLDYDFLFSNA